MPVAISLLVFVFVVATLIDIIRREDSQIRHLPKIVWILIVILIPLLGSILWWAIGREYPEHVTMPRPRAQRAPQQPRQPLIVDDRHPRTDTRSTEQQMADLDREIEEWRLKDELRKNREAQGEAPAGE